MNTMELSLVTALILVDQLHIAIYRKNKTLRAASKLKILYIITTTERKNRVEVR